MQKKYLSLKKGSLEALQETMSEEWKAGGF